MDTIDKLVYGHTQAKKVLAVLIARSQERYYRKCVLGLENVRAPLKCLLVGQSGTGKTHLIRSLRKIHNFPLITLDATQLMPTGNDQGVNIKQLRKIISDKVAEELKASKEAHDGRFHSAEGVLNQLVIFVDEIDKLGTSFDASGNWNKHVQSSFLTIIDTDDELSGVSWVFAGAFSSLYDKKASAHIGFSKQEPTKAQEFGDTDIIKSGIIPELLGRISLIVQLDTLTEEDYKTVLVDRLLPQFYSLKLTDEQIVDIAHKAFESNQGVRSLTRQLEMLDIDADFEQITSRSLTVQ